LLDQLRLDLADLANVYPPVKRDPIRSWLLFRLPDEMK